MDRPTYCQQATRFCWHKFWARGYFVSTVGANEKVIRAYIESQEKEDKRLDDLFDR
jgi:putative transposase